MNEKLNLTWNVTKWEFSRFFKWVDLFKGALYMILAAVIGGGVTLWLSSDTFEIPVIAIADYGEFNPEDFVHEQLSFTDQTDATTADLEALLETESADAIVKVVSTDSAVVRAEGERAWLLTLENFLSELRSQQKLQNENIDPDLFDALQKGITLHILTETEENRSVADKVIAGISIFLVLMAVFMGFAYQFTAITAEKQQRITEQVISAIDPQTWIDGKILGITGIGLVYVLFYGGLSLTGTLVLTVYAGPAFGNEIMSLNPLLAVIFVSLAFLGVLMWNCFFSAVAATINDPNSSERSGLMLLPILPVMFAFFTLVNPDSFAIKVLGIFPITSYAILPARMVLSEVAAWEILLAFVLLILTIWLFRRVAGKIFAVSMMMYGKEPTIKEITYWFSKS